MGVRIPLVEINGPKGSFQSLLLICNRSLRPAVGNNARVHARKPDMGFRELGVELTGMPEQLARPQVMFSDDVMKMPSTAPHQVPGSHVAGVTRGGFSALAFEQFRFDRARNALGDLILDCEHFR